VTTPVKGGDRGPLVYFALLVPSISISLATMPIEIVRKQVAFYLAGPLTLGVSGWYFSRFRLDTEDSNRILTGLLGPVCAILTIAFVSSQSAAIEFSDSSNYATSGGYGPNQVSAVLGLGAVICFLRFSDGQLSRVGPRIAYAALLLVLGIQTALTFSRGGLYGAGIAVALFLTFSARNRAARRRLVITFLGVLIAAEGIIYPWLEARTGGAITERFTDTGTTGREEFAEREIQAFLDEPILGYGPGGARAVRSERRMASHTEYTRMLAEHGAFGLLSLLVLLYMSGMRVLRAASPLDRAFAATFIGWTLVFMLHAGMRLAAPAFIFGLAMASFVGRRTPRPVPSSRPVAAGPDVVGTA
jgi:hypothetical protein